uniref:AlNc14C256G9730 protein n=1 Tax=Albugo laibachii Nc14 TaxID=890382 RepID=F0WTQ6_9STRA|nr:AlNc14C256G9730 [Albugo laibachii Nc14]|eukprot:CCA24748.1 AlNc14C256G9730 [Albugo laibachii Nc14]
MKFLKAFISYAFVIRGMHDAKKQVRSSQFIKETNREILLNPLDIENNEEVPDSHSEQVYELLVT